MSKRPKKQPATAKKPVGPADSRQDPQAIIVKFRKSFIEELHLSYDRVGAQRILARLGAPWISIESSHAPLSLGPLFTELPPSEITAIEAEAKQRDETYDPPNLLTYYELTIPSAADAVEIASLLRSPALSLPSTMAYPESNHAPAGDSVVCEPGVLSEPVAERRNRRLVCVGIQPRRRAAADRLRGRVGSYSPGSSGGLDHAAEWCEHGGHRSRNQCPRRHLRSGRRSWRDRSRSRSSRGRSRLRHRQSGKNPRRTRCSTSHQAKSGGFNVGDAS